jgi:hypothetical protein
MSDNRWRPDQNEVDKEYSDIESNYGTRRVRGKVPQGYEPLVMEFAKIAVFLKNDKAVLLQLKKLNALLVEEAKRRHLPINFDDPNEVYLKHNKLLRNVLEQELEKIGFQPELAKALDYIPPKIFRSTIREGILIKDPGAKIEHGEFTHAIQWLIIGWQQNDTHFLNNSVIDIFKELGSDRSVIYNNSDGSEKNMWDLLVDKLYSKDCGSPEYLHTLIKQSNDDELSLLKILCLSRVKKREYNLPYTSIFAESNENKIYPKREYDVSKQDKNLLISRKKKD